MNLETVFTTDPVESLHLKFVLKRRDGNEAGPAIQQTIVLQHPTNNNHSQNNNRRDGNNNVQSHNSTLLHNANGTTNNNYQTSQDDQHVNTNNNNYNTYNNNNTNMTNAFNTNSYNNNNQSPQTLGHPAQGVQSSTSNVTQAPLLSNDTGTTQRNNNVNVSRQVLNNSGMRVEKVNEDEATPCDVRLHWQEKIFSYEEAYKYKTLSTKLYAASSYNNNGNGNNNLNVTPFDRFYADLWRESATEGSRISTLTTRDMEMDWARKLVEDDLMNEVLTTTTDADTIAAERAYLRDVLLKKNKDDGKHFFGVLGYVGGYQLNTYDANDNLVDVRFANNNNNNSTISNDDKIKKEKELQEQNAKKDEEERRRALQNASTNPMDAYDQRKENMTRSPFDDPMGATNQPQGTTRNGDIEKVLFEVPRSDQHHVNQNAYKQYNSSAASSTSLPFNYGRDAPLYQGGRFVLLAFFVWDEKKSCLKSYPGLSKRSNLTTASAVLRTVADGSALSYGPLRRTFSVDSAVYEYVIEVLNDVPEKVRYKQRQLMHKQLAAALTFKWKMMFGDLAPRVPLPGLVKVCYFASLKAFHATPLAAHDPLGHISRVRRFFDAVAGDRVSVYYRVLLPRDGRWSVTDPFEASHARDQWWGCFAADDLNDIERKLKGEGMDDSTNTLSTANNNKSISNNTTKESELNAKEQNEIVRQATQLFMQKGQKRRHRRRLMEQEKDEESTDDVHSAADLFSEEEEDDDDDFNNNNNNNSSTGTLGRTKKHLLQALIKRISAPQHKSERQKAVQERIRKANHTLIQYQRESLAQNVSAGGGAPLVAVSGSTFACVPAAGDGVSAYEEAFDFKCYVMPVAAEQPVEAFFSSDNAGRATQNGLRQRNKSDFPSSHGTDRKQRDAFLKEHEAIAKERAAVCATLPSAPRLCVQVLATDYLGRQRLIGYGSQSVPVSPGAHEIVLKLWRPQLSHAEESRRQFIGGVASLLDLNLTAFTAEGRLATNRHNLMTESDIGVVSVQLNCAHQINVPFALGTQKINRIK